MKSFKPSSVAAQSRVLKSEIQSKHHLTSSPPMKPSTATLSVILVLSVVVQLAGGFNLSPQPNHVFKEPTLQTFREKVRSSYFGFALNLRPGGWVPPNNTWFIVGHAKWWASSGQTVELRLLFCRMCVMCGCYLGEKVHAQELQGMQWYLYHAVYFLHFLLTAGFVLDRIDKREEVCDCWLVSWSRTDQIWEWMNCESLGDLFYCSI